jgi:GMP synthase (glutamine-hydrolysing)
VYAVQFHPEYDLETAKAMIHSKDIADASIQAALDSCTEANVSAAQAPKQIFDNFLQHVNQAQPAIPSLSDS